VKNESWQRKQQFSHHRCDNLIYFPKHFVTLWLALRNTRIRAYFLQENVFSSRQRHIAELKIVSQSSKYPLTRNVLLICSTPFAARNVNSHLYLEASLFVPIS